METEKLGTLEDAELRDVWRNETHNFTPWLAENLECLSEVLGISLEYVDKEVEIGPNRFRADIVARDPLDNVVLIENQLDDADLQHLGQVLTYLAGLNAHTVIWIARRFDEAYLSAIRWLNDHTRAPFAFLAIQIRVVKIGDSPVAPVLEVLEKPNEWDRRVKAIIQSTVGTELGRFRQRFWNYVAQRHPGEVRPDYAGGNVNHTVEKTGLQISQYVMIDGGVGVFLTTRRGDDSDLRSRVAPYLEPLRKALEERSPQDNLKLSEYGGMSLTIDSQNEANWDRMADWLHEKRTIYEDVLRNSSV